MKNTLHFLLAAFLLGFLPCAHAQIITTIAGGGSPISGNGDGGPADSAELFHPIGVAADGVGNLYIADRDDNCIRKVNSSGIITTIAGTGTTGFSGDNGAATAAEINYPYGVTVDGLGNVYFADELNNRIRKINTSGIISTIAGTGIAGYNGDNISATSAELNEPSGIAVDGSGSVYVADYSNNRIRMINTSGIITTYAGTGTGAFGGDNGLAIAAEIYHPYFIALDGSRNLYIADIANNRLRKVNNTGIITTIAGNGTPGTAGDNGPATAAELDLAGVAVDNSGNIYIGDPTDDIVRKIDASGIITTIAGTGVDGYNGDNIPATDAELSSPVGVAVDAADNIYIADFGNARIRYIANTVFVNTIVNAVTDIKTYPNPNQGIFMLNISSVIDEQVQITITNILGEKVNEVTAKTNEPIVVQLNVPVGIYILSVNDGHGISNSKIDVINKCC